MNFAHTYTHKPYRETEPKKMKIQVSYESGTSGKRGVR